MMGSMDPFIVHVQPGITGAKNLPSFGLNFILMSFGLSFILKGFNLSFILKGFNLRFILMGSMDPFIVHVQPGITGGQGPGRGWGS